MGSRLIIDSGREHSSNFGPRRELIAGDLHYLTYHM